MSFYNSSEEVEFTPLPASLTLPSPRYIPQLLNLNKDEKKMGQGKSMEEEISVKMVGIKIASHSGQDLGHVVGGLALFPPGL
jgi:hypothetical protein